MVSREEMQAFETQQLTLFRTLEETTNQHVAEAIESLKGTVVKMVDDGWKEANKAFTSEQTAVRELVEGMRRDLSAVGTEGLSEVAGKITRLDADYAQQASKLNIFLNDFRARSC